jgi:hypothetical protein
MTHNTFFEGFGWQSGTSRNRRALQLMSPFDSAGKWFTRLVDRWRSSTEVRLSTTLSSDEVLNRMRQESLEPRFFRFTGPAQSVVGRFRGRRFSLVAAGAISHNQARQFYGEVLTTQGGAAIRGRFQQRPALRIGRFIIFSIVFLAGVLTSIRMRDPKPAVITLLAIAALGFLDRHQMQRGAPFEDEVTDFLARVSDQPSKS